MITPLSSGLAGVRAFERKVEVAAKNVANIGTRDYQKSRVALQEGPAGGVTATVQRIGAPEPGQLSNVDLGEEMVGMLVGERGFEANLKTIQVADEMLGALLDLKG